MVDLLLVFLFFKEPPYSFPREGNGNPLQSYQENPVDRGAWWAAVHWVAQGQTRLKRLSSSSSSSSILVSKVAAPICILINRIQRFSTSSSTFVICRLFSDSHSSSKNIHAPQCSQQHHLWQPRHGSTCFHQQLSG